ncbi:MAG: ester cyclase [Chthoniobacter sp.]
MPDPITHVLKSWFEEVWNNAREEAIDELAARDMVAYGLVRCARTAHRGEAEIQGVLAPVPRCVSGYSRGCRGGADPTGTRKSSAAPCGPRTRGAGLGLAATNKPIKFSGVVIARVEGGKLAEAWDSWDFLGLYQQIGRRARLRWCSP